VGSPILVATSSTLPHSSDDRGAIAADLRKLAMLALPLGIKIAYTALSWGRAIVDFKGALDVVARADMPNLGIGIDSFQALATKSALDELEMVLAETILLVQLGLHGRRAFSNETGLTAEHLRVFPVRACTAQLADFTSASPRWDVAATNAS
jgi:hypothetical protein